MMCSIDISATNFVQSTFDLLFIMNDKNETDESGSFDRRNLVYEARLWRGGEEFWHTRTIQKPCRIDRVFDEDI